MELLLMRFPKPTATSPVRPIPCLFLASKRNRYRVFSALEKEEDDPYFQAAMERASLRFQETLRPGMILHTAVLYPLFIDPYIRCLLPPDIQMDVNHGLHEHCLATKFLDDKLLSTIQNDDGLRQSTRTKWMDKLFMSHGLKVKMIKHDEVARNLGKESAPGDHKNILFVAEQLQFSDDQMEIWRREFQRIEEEGDEEGFEEL
ncbi:O-methyltransferase 1, chloroplastic [Sesamum angolense]|uniref:O-methyltransferase 1, chloroplastic n=1 Tax=Sesamum angolense TaxID=2727404 RepID=A0AAE2C3R3_9LAMI|nr:O-methyltransferase 1, chloroplastic [Sesamum angolense]